MEYFSVKEWCEFHFEVELKFIELMETMDLDPSLVEELQELSLERPIQSVKVGAFDMITFFTFH